MIQDKVPYNEVSGEVSSPLRNIKRVEFTLPVLCRGGTSEKDLVSVCHLTETSSVESWWLPKKRESNEKTF